MNQLYGTSIISVFAFSPCKKKFKFANILLFTFGPCLVLVYVNLFGIGIGPSNSPLKHTKNQKRKIVYLQGLEAYIYNLYFT